MSILSIARSLMAVMQPATGTRSSGTALVRSASSAAIIPRSSYAIPIVGGAARPDLLVKVAANPDEDDGSWAVDADGESVGFISNIGGARHNLDAGTRLLFDPPLAGVELEAVVEAPGMAGGLNPTSFASLQTLAMLETFGDLSRKLELFRGKVAHFPAAILTWTDSEPADGSTIPMNNRRTRVSTAEVLYKEQFQLWIVSSRLDSDHQRRAQGLAILHNLRTLLTDRREVDGCPFSNPSGVQIRRAYRDPGDGREIYQAFYVYVLELSAEEALVQQDSRTFNPWELTRLDVDPVDNDPDEPIVDNNLVDMTP